MREHWGGGWGGPLGVDLWQDPDPRRKAWLVIAPAPDIRDGGQRLPGVTVGAGLRRVDLRWLWRR